MRRTSVFLIVLSIAGIGQVYAQANPVASPSPLSFGTAVLRDSKSLFLSITNTGNAPITYTGKTGPFSADYKLANAGGNSVLDPDSSLGFTVTFSPQSITATHIHLDSIHFKFTGIPDVVVQLIGLDHVPVLDSVSIDDTFLGYAGQLITIAQRLNGPLTGALDSIRRFSEFLTYDPQIMTLQSILPGPCLQGWNVPSPPLELVLGHPQIFGTATYRAMTGPGPFLFLVFRLVPYAQVFQSSSIVQDNFLFGTGFEPLMSSLPGKVTVIDSCTPVATTLVTLGTMIEPNMPNPFQSETVFTYQVGPSATGEAVHVRLQLYDARGQRAARLVDEDAVAGTHSVTMQRGGLAAGVYSCVYEAGAYRSVRKVVVLP